MARSCTSSSATRPGISSASRSPGSGDNNADGFDDIIAGAPFADGIGGVDSGYTRTLSGADGSVLSTAPGPVANLQLGYQLANLGDLDDDGYDDVAISGPGAVRVFSGRTAAGIFTLRETNPGDEFGEAIAGAGDVNGDGTPDIIVGAPGAGGGAGEVQVFSGTDASVLHTLTNPSVRFGSAVDGVGDINSDGRDDFVVAADSVTRGNRVLVLSGLDGSVLHDFSGAGGRGRGRRRWRWHWRHCRRPMAARPGDDLLGRQWLRASQLPRLCQLRWRGRSRR